MILASFIRTKPGFERTMVFRVMSSVAPNVSFIPYLVLKLSISSVYDEVSQITLAPAFLALAMVLLIHLMFPDLHFC